MLGTKRAHALKSIRSSLRRRLFRPTRHLTDPTIYSTFFLLQSFASLSYSSPSDFSLTCQFSTSPFSEERCLSGDANKIPNSAMADADEKQSVDVPSPYELKPFSDENGLGAEVFGIDLKKQIPPEIVEKIKKDVTHYRIVVFRNQGVVSGERQVEISKWFGELESTFYKHQKSPHPDVFRVSNDEKEGCRNVGRTGWHIDGSFMETPFSHSVYHMPHVPKASTTSFMPLREMYERLSEENQERWKRLYMVSDVRTGPIHPLVYRHPLSGLTTLCFHLGMIQGFLLDYGTDKQRLLRYTETATILKEIEDHIKISCKDLIYHHSYGESGDVILSDNLAVAHEASPDTQNSRDEIGLRVLHRCTIRGKHKPIDLQLI